MGILKKINNNRKRPTKGFSELNKRTYEARSREGRSNDYRSRSYNNVNRFNYENFSNNDSFSRNRFSENSYSTRASFSEYGRGTSKSRYFKEHNKNQKRFKKRFIAAIIAGVIGILALGGWAYAAIIGGNINSGMSGIGLTPTSLNQPFYMVLMGVDSSEQRKGDPENGNTDNSFRSDSIILSRIDPVKKKVSMISLHRDTQIDMGKYGIQKLNAAHSLGGPELVVSCVSKLAGVDINHYAEVNFDGFKTAVDNVGGVEIDVPIEIADPMAGYVPQGRQVLDGNTALVLCRSRHTYDDLGDGDQYRAANQRNVLAAVGKKLLQSDIATIAKTITDVSKYVKTDLSISDVIGLAQRMRDLDFNEDVYSAMQPTTSKYINGVWYEITNETEWKEMMTRFKAGLPPSEETIIDENTGIVLSIGGKSEEEETNINFYSGSVNVKNGTILDGLANSAAEKLQKKGFTTSTGNTKTPDYTNTVIVYTDDNQKSTAEAIRSTLKCGTVIQNNNKYLYDTDYLVIIGEDYKK